MPPSNPIKLKPIWCKEHGRRYQVIDDTDYLTDFGKFTVPDGFITDLASVPKLFRSILPHDGKYLEAAILHDWMYRTHCVTQKQADVIFLSEMKRLKVPLIKRRLIYRAVRMFGWKAYKRHNHCKGDNK